MIHPGIAALWLSSWLTRCDVLAASIDREHWWAEALARYQAGERANLPRDLHQAAADHRGERIGLGTSLEEDIHDAVVDLDIGGFTLERAERCGVRNIRTRQPLWEATRQGDADAAVGLPFEIMGFKRARTRLNGVRQWLWAPIP